MLLQFFPRLNEKPKRKLIFRSIGVGAFETIELQNEKSILQVDLDAEQAKFEQKRELSLIQWVPTVFIVSWFVIVKWSFKVLMI